MLYLKWLVLCLLDLLLYLTLPFVTPFIALFTKAEGYDKELYSWGGWYGTYDNPPEGDEGFVSKRSFFPNVVTGWKGYINRLQWMWRNKLYGFAKVSGIKYSPDLVLTYTGNPDISDKNKIPGKYFAKLHKDGKLVGFEFYMVWPYTDKRDVRIRIGWKIMTDKFERYGFAQLVNTFNPVDGYGDE